MSQFRTVLFGNDFLFIFQDILRGETFFRMLLTGQRYPSSLTQIWKLQIELQTLLSRYRRI
jgi:hypothetical protein